MTSFRFFLSSCGAALLGLTSPTSAQLLTAVDQGNYDDFGFHDPAWGGYTTGWFGSAPEYRSFFVFDRSSISGTITSATLRIANPAPYDEYPEAGFTSGNPFETFSIFDVSTDITALLDGTADAFADLGSGTAFGSVSVSDADDGQWISIDLNADFLTAINGTSGMIALGGTLSSLEQVEFFEVLFAGSDDQSPLAELSVVTGISAVPEPSTYGLMGAAALLGFTALRRRARRSGS